MATEVVFTRFKLKRNTAVDLASIVLLEGEPAVNLDTGDRVVGDGVTAGGYWISPGFRISTLQDGDMPVWSGSTFSVRQIPAFTFTASGDVTITSTGTSSQGYKVPGFISTELINGKIPIANGGKFELKEPGPAITDPSSITTPTTSPVVSDGIGDLSAESQEVQDAMDHLSTELQTTRNELKTTTEELHDLRSKFAELLQALRKSSGVGIIEG